MATFLRGNETPDEYRGSGAMHADPAGPDASSLGPSMRVCVVEDHPTIREWLLRLLHDVRVEVVAVADSAAAGLEAITAHRPDLAIIASRLPDGDGVDLCHAISASLADVALVLFATTFGPLEAKKAAEAGVDHVVLKTLSAGDDLVAALEVVGARLASA